MSAIRRIYEDVLVLYSGFQFLVRYLDVSAIQYARFFGGFTVHNNKLRNTFSAIYNWNVNFSILNISIPSTFQLAVVNARRKQLHYFLFKFLVYSKEKKLQTILQTTSHNT